jgi:hypothetical protein
MNVETFVRSKWFRMIRWALWLTALVAFGAGFVQRSYVGPRVGMIAFAVYFCITMASQKFGPKPKTFGSPIPNTASSLSGNGVAPRGSDQ